MKPKQIDAKNITFLRKNLLLRISLIFCSFFWGVTVSFAGSPSIVDFDWTMADRFGLDADGDGVIDALDTSELVNPGSFAVTFDACDIAIDSDWRTYPLLYRWWIDGREQGRTHVCESTVFLKEGDHSVRLVLANAAGSSVSSEEQNVRVQDWLIVSAGDSFASGEGNPDIPAPDFAAIPGAVGGQLTTCGVATFDFAATRVDDLTAAIESNITNIEGALNEQLVQAQSDLDSLIRELVSLKTSYEAWQASCFPAKWWEFDPFRCDRDSAAFIVELGQHVANAVEVVGQGVGSVSAVIESLPENARIALENIQDTIAVAEQNLQNAKDELGSLKLCIDGVIADAFEAGDDDLETGRLGSKWIDWQCHRSMNSKEALAALELERSDPKTSVTFVSTACGGGTMENGLLNRFSGVSHPEMERFWLCEANNSHQYCCDEIGGCKEGQLTRIKALTGNREIDSLLISAGGNDMGFIEILIGCMVTDNCNEDVAYYRNAGRTEFLNLCSTYGDTLPVVGNWLADACSMSFEQYLNTVIPELEGNEGTLVEKSAKTIFDNRIGTLPALYSRLNQAINDTLGVLSERIYITEYPSMAKNENGGFCASDNYPLDEMLPGFRQQEVVWIENDLTVALNQEIANAANEHGWQVVDGIYSAYSSFNAEAHGYCSSSAWVRRMQDSFALQGDNGGVMHPAFEGNQHVASAILTSDLRDDFYTAGEPRPLAGRPMANIRGPYTIQEGEKLVPVHKSMDEVYPRGDLSCYWSQGFGIQVGLKEGTILTPDDPALWTPTFTAKDDGEVQLKVRVTNPAGQVDVGSTLVTIQNVAPEVSLIPLIKGKYYTGSQYAFRVKFSDPGVYDTHRVTVDWGDGSDPETMADAVSPMTLYHVFTTSDTFTVEVMVADDDGGEGSSDRIVAVALHPLASDDDGDGYSEYEGDCDDNNRYYVYPGAEEICDHIDNNCDGKVDEGDCRVIYVNGSATGSNNGTSWDDAYVDLQDALAEAVSGRQIWVAKGTYTPGTSRSDSFTIGRGIELYGGFGGYERRIEKRKFDLNRTILSGDIGVVNEIGDNSYHVVTSVGPAGLPLRLDGFTIAHGNATGDSNPDGGALLTPHDNIILNCTFFNNQGRNGGAVDADSGAMGGGASFTNCRFLGNNALELGGAVYLHENTLSFSNCVFSGNKAGRRGGAIAAEEYSGFDLLFSTLANNRAVNYGGAIDLFNSTNVDVMQQVDITGSILWGNEVTGTEQRGNEIAVRGHYFDVNIDYSAISFNEEGYLPHTFYDQHSSSISFGDHNQDQRYPVQFVSSRGNDSLAGTLDDNLRLAFDMDPESHGSGGINSADAALLPADSTDIDNDGDSSEPLPFDLDHRTRTHGNVDMGAYENNSFAWYVDSSATGGQDGRSWGNAFVFLQDALAMALSYDIIRVAEGLYKPDRGTGRVSGDRMATFAMEDYVSLRGGYKNGGTERDIAQYITVLSGDIGIENDMADNSYHVVTADHVNDETSISGFTIRDGNANANYHPENKGGGVILKSSDMNLADCIVENNHARHRGGGIWIGNDSPSIRRTVLYDNSALEGGGMAMENASAPQISFCTFLGNSASDDGGAVNSANTDNALFRNNVFSGNAAADKGGAVMSRGGDHLSFENNTFFANSGVYGGGIFVASASEVSFTDSILWGNDAEHGSQVAVRDSSFTANWSLIAGAADSFYLENAVAVNTANIYLFDPLFVDNDLHLASLSQAIDAGDPAKSYSYEPDDNGGRLNLGRYGNTAEATVSRTSGGTILYVDGSASGNNTGASWGDAMVSMQYALAVARSGDQIWVAEGIYSPDEQQFAAGDRNASFQLKNGVELYGGFHSGDLWTDRDAAQKVTVLSGDLNGDDQNDFNNFDENSQHVVVGSGTDSSAILDGFTISGGYATDEVAYPANGGAGMYNENGSPTISHCVFEYNLADARGGGGILNHENSSPEISYSIFRNNRGGNGGALYNAYNSDSHIHHTLFAGNNGGQGGAVELVSSDVLLENCSFTNNQASIRGGALRAYDSQLVINNSIFWANMAPAGQGAQVGLDSAGLVITYSDVAGGQADIYTDNSSVNWSTGNIEDIDPLFTDSLASLYAYSDCMDSGDPSSDYSAEPDPNGGRINMGVWGGTGNATESIVDNDDDGIENDVEMTSCSDQDDADTDNDAVPDGVEDANHNGIVDPGETDPCNSDTDGDGIQDGVELGYTLQDLGSYTNPDNFQSDIDPSFITDPLLVDTDSDGFSDLREFVDGTNPLDKDSVLDVYQKTKVTKTGQQTCYNNAGTVIPCVGTGQDGDVQGGVPFPTPRFTDLGDGTVKDHLTGLVWLKDAGCFAHPSSGVKSFENAIGAAGTLKDQDCGLTDGSVEGDWRLPNIRELSSLVNYEYSPTLSNAAGTDPWQEGDPFVGVADWGHFYWTSTAYAGSERHAWQVDFEHGAVDERAYSHARKLWPIKGESAELSAEAVILLPQTGLTGTRNDQVADDDRTVQAGIPLPDIRFTDNNDGTITDNLTGLIWLKNTACHTIEQYPTEGHEKVLNHIATLNAAGTMNDHNCGDLSNDGSYHTDWRLPSIKELHSLIDFSLTGPASPSGHPFVAIGDNTHQFRYTQSGTNSPNAPSNILWMDMTDGAIHLGAKSDYRLNLDSMLAVRGGQTGPAYGLSITTAGSGTGTVTSAPEGIDCGSDCGNSYPGDTVVALSASADPGFVFIGWSGDADCEDGEVTMDGVKNCIAGFSELAQVVQTGQVTCFDMGGETIPCAGTGQDGEFMYGISLPAPRFTDLGDGTVKDNLTGLVWLKDADCIGEKNWNTAIDEANTLSNGECGLSDGSSAGDWRLPNVRELRSLLNAEYYAPMISNTSGTGQWQNHDPFTKDESNDYYWGNVYWSSTAFANDQRDDVAWHINMANGKVSSQPHAFGYSKVWPVKGGLSPTTGDGVVLLPKTGQTESVRAGDDGDIQAGTILPDASVRFTNNGDGTVTDNFTGLIWLQEGNCSQAHSHLSENYSFIASLNSDGAMNGHDCGDRGNEGSHQTDWRMPTVNEMESLIDYSIVDHLGQNLAVSSPHYFNNLLNHPYATATRAKAGEDQFTVALGNGNYGGVSPSSLSPGYDYHYLLPVRGGVSGMSYGLSVTLAGTGSGHVSTIPEGITCGADCGQSYSTGTEVTLTAVADIGSLFAGWSGDCSEFGIVTLDSNKSCTATFQLQKYILQIPEPGPGTEMTTSSEPAGIHCGTDCYEEYDYGTVVTLSVSPPPGLEFYEWTGDTDCEDGIVTMVQHLRCAPYVIPILYTVTVEKTGTGSGTVSSYNSQIQCGSDCYADTIPYNYSMKLQASPDTGTTFEGWGGDCAGMTDFSIAINVKRNLVCTADFVPKQTLALRTAGTGYGTITNDVSAHSCSSYGEQPCSSDYRYGTTVTLSATALNGSTFEGWGGDADCLDGIVTMGNGRNCMATFTLKDYPLTITRSGAGSGTVTSEPQGVVCGSDCEEQYPFNSDVQLTAIPSADSTFMGWYAPCSTSGKVAIDEAKSCDARFELKHTIDITVEGTGSGTIRSSSGGINCGTLGTDCSYTFDYGAGITLTPIPSSRMLFSGWSGDCSNIENGFVEMTRDMQCIATFEPEKYTMRVASNAQGPTITIDPPGVECSTADCRYEFDAYTEVALLINPNGWIFDGWVEPECGNLHLFTMVQDYFCTAQFTPARILTVQIAGNGTAGTGTIRSVPVGIDCGSSCNSKFERNSTVTLAATPSADSEFLAWSSGCENGRVTMTANRECTAIFGLKKHKLSVNIRGTGVGEVTSNPALISSCSQGICSADFYHGTEVNLTARAFEGYTFDGWTGDCSSNEEDSVTLDLTSDKVCSATFSVKKHTLTIQKTGDGSGTVTGNRVSCGEDCTYHGDWGSNVFLTATPAPGSVHVEGCSGWYQLKEDTVCRATFRRKPILTIVRQGSATGGVTSWPYGIECGAKCSEAFTPDRTVRLTRQSPGLRAIFSGWSGDCSGTEETIRVLMDEDKTCSVEYLIDSDSDLVADVSDNCPAMHNPRQHDANGDGVGDVCENNDDHDGILSRLDGRWIRETFSFIDEAALYSNHFTDQYNGGYNRGRTYGSIAARNDLTLMVSDASNYSKGVLVHAFGEETGNALLKICDHDVEISSGTSLVATCGLRADSEIEYSSKMAKKLKAEDGFLIETLSGTVIVQLGNDQYLVTRRDAKVTITESSDGIFNIQNISDTDIRYVTATQEVVLKTGDQITVRVAKFPWHLFMAPILGAAAQ